MATVARLRRRPIVLSAFLLVIVYIAISLLRGPRGSLSSPTTWEPRAIIPNLRSSINAGAQAAFGSGSDAANGALAAPSPQAAPGFERALPSCRVSDLLDDPLTQEYGQNNIRLSRTYEGSGARVRKVLQKAMRGEPIKIAAVGGSVSTVSGGVTLLVGLRSIVLHVDLVDISGPRSAVAVHIRELHVSFLGGALWWRRQQTTASMADLCLYDRYKRIQQWFLDTFPGAKHELNLDSAIPATTAWYFSVGGEMRQGGTP